MGNSYHVVRFGVHYFCVVKMIENNVLGVYKKNFAGGALKYCLQTQLYLELVRLLVVAVECIITDYSTCPLWESLGRFSVWPVTSRTPRLYV